VDGVGAEWPFSTVLAAFGGWCGVWSGLARGEWQVVSVSSARSLRIHL